MAPGEPAVLVADMSKVQRRLSWSPATDIQSGLAEVVQSAP
jgi:UDP-glucose 4-epimerase